MVQVGSEALTLKVAEAPGKDVGRVMARLDPQDMTRIGAEVGDIIQIVGKRPTVAKVMPAYTQDRGKDTIQIDGVTRENAQAGLGEKVEVQRIHCESADTLVLAPVTPSSAFVKEKDRKYLGRLLEGLPMTPGDKVRVTLLGSRYQEFLVADASPNGAVAVGPVTTIKVKGEVASDKGKTGITYEDIGGLQKEIQRIREIFTEIPDVKWDDVDGLEEAKRLLMETIEWPLKYPELFDQANTRPAKGILLTGPPGTGKTLLAKAVASQSEVNFISVKGPALLSKWVGESERGIREVFRKAKQASPCIIFFDEIDAIAPVRGSSADSHVTERVISQFLTELNGIEELKGIVVLAASNRPDIIDPALLRPGRFDIQLELPVPDEKTRLEIFKIHTKDKPLANDVKLESLAKTTEGLVGSGIEGICRSASMLAIREFVNELGSRPEASEISAFKIAAKHFEQALETVRK